MIRTMNTLSIKILEETPDVAYQHFSAPDKAKMCAIKGEFPDFSKPCVYDAYWDTMSLIDSGKDSEVSKLLLSLMKQLDIKNSNSVATLSPDKVSPDKGIKCWSEFIRSEIDLIKIDHDGLNSHFYEYMTKFGIDLFKNRPSSYKDCTIEILDKYEIHVGKMRIKIMTTMIPDFDKVVVKLDLMFERLYTIMDASETVVSSTID